MRVSVVNNPLGGGNGEKYTTWGEGVVSGQLHLSLYQRLCHPDRALPTSQLVEPKVFEGCCGPLRQQPIAGTAYSHIKHGYSRQ